MVLLMILMCLVWSTLFVSIMFYFTDDSCLPHKRKLEKILDNILYYQKKHNKENGIEISYKGKQFLVSVSYTQTNYCYGQYVVWINGNLVKTFHILEHLFSKSRREQHHGDMREYEEDEIIAAAYKLVKKRNKENFNEQWDKSSYFN